ncbi:ATPase protein [Sarocladium strictum]
MSYLPRGRLTGHQSDQIAESASTRQDIAVLDSCLPHQNFGRGLPWTLWVVCGVHISVWTTTYFEVKRYQFAETKHGKHKYFELILGSNALYRRLLASVGDGGPVIDKTKAASFNKAFREYLEGKRTVATLHEARVFFDAIQLQSSPSECLERIVGGKAGLKAVRHSVRVSLDKEFVRLKIFPFLFHFSDPEATALYDGTFLHQLIKEVVSPPTAWKNITKIYQEDTILHEEKESEIFAWLCLQIARHPEPELSSLAKDVGSVLSETPLLNLPWTRTRGYAYLIKNALDAKTGAATALDDASGLGGPGGRHDNDFQDFRQTAIFPTSDELTSTLKPFFRTANEVAQMSSSLRPACHLDNQFRLYRADFLSEMREDLAAIIRPGKGTRRQQVLSRLSYVGVSAGEFKRTHDCALKVSFGSGLTLPRKLDEQGRRDYLRDHPRILGHHSLGVFLDIDKVIEFAFVVRDNAELARAQPVISLRFLAAQSLSNAFQALTSRPDLRFAIVDSSWFAYEPVLERLKQITELPLQNELLMLTDAEGPAANPFKPTDEIRNFANRCREHAAQNKAISVAGKSYVLDEAQAGALTDALLNALSVIQGPPGTGKSFLGALIVKLLLQIDSSKVLVMSYTNHSTDQMLDDLCEIGISRDSMTRLGSKYKASLRTADLCLDAQIQNSDHRMDRSQWEQVDILRSEMQELSADVSAALSRFNSKVSDSSVLDFLELDGCEQSHKFWAAFNEPTSDGSFHVAGKAGKKLKPEALLNQWHQGQGPGSARSRMSQESQNIWALSPFARGQLMAKWRTSITQERVEAVTNLVSQIDEAQSKIDIILNESKCAFAATRRVIGCTTTSAAKNMALLKAFKPTCILVEEAGEILESHVLAALCPSTEQLVLIGDHKQLRPKCNSYALSVEMGDGFDLNRSLFERLIIEGQRHVTLKKQHRMAPEISEIVRSLTYPDLQDGDKTIGRSRIRGLCSRVVFVNHDQPEEVHVQIDDRGDAGSKGSKQNTFEAEMVLKIVKYLGQQGYKSENIVVLTPYLGQLRLLRDMLSRENDPILSDLDSAELLRANLLTNAAAKVDKAQIKLSSIDNYQGEESDIVVASLTRSNTRGDIGFMKAPERLNVLVSRARDCLIMIGNMATFMKAPNGQETWHPFFKQLKEKDFLHDGIQVRCERHPDRVATLLVPDDFDEKCPEGGCSEICQVMLPCGIHACQLKCHRLADHSKVICTALEEMECEKGHKYKVRCGQPSKACPVCLKEEADMRRRAKRQLDLERKRLAKQAQYQQELEIIQDEIAHLKRLDEIEAEEKAENKSLAEEQNKLAALKKAKEQRDTLKQASIDALEKQKASDLAGISQAQDFQTSVKATTSPAQMEWNAMKNDELAQSQELDTLMGMIGHESIKRMFLDIKGQVDVATKQGIGLGDDRFGCTLLGNPGTGKTTVARIYGRFLTSMGVLPGPFFEETTGSKLATMGSKGCQQLIDNVLDNGGGVIFIDEAYQLSSGNSPGGAAVLDFLLAEVENLRTQIVFVLAGYDKQMESFFAHNPGFPSRFPLTMKFDDYDDEELLDIFALQINNRFKGRMQVENGSHGLYARVAMRRLGRGRGKQGFGNARAVENTLSMIYRNQARRIKAERHKAKKKADPSVPEPDVLQLTKVDIIGPRPSQALLQSKAWTALQELIGLDSVKESVQVLVDTLEANYDRELLEQPIIEYSLNRVFLGNPGTGKTTVAKLYGQLLAQIGALSIGDVVVKCPADFVGDVLGASEKTTKGILDSTVGKVLLIDEAYSFYGSGGGADIYKTAAIDTIVANVHSTPGDDRCILMLGYREQMHDMLKNMNPGLLRRFPLQSAFVFEDFDPVQLATIFRFKLKKQGFKATPKAEEVALQMLERARSQPQFGNAGEVDILLDAAKSRHQKRLSAGKTKRKETLEALDFDEEYDRGTKADVAHLFEGTVGSEHIVSLLQGYQTTVRQVVALGMNPKESIPFNFLFRGPPGTGKTTTARKMGKVFYNAGILGSAEVVECSTSDLIGQYVGQTGPKVRDALDKALGKVLFIDEAYRFASGGGGFAQEALDEIVDACTKERYYKKLIIILAGYEKDINTLLTANPGLSSRFPEVVDFRPLSASACLQLLITELAKKKKEVEALSNKNSMSIKCFFNAELRHHLVQEFSRACQLEGWASARDVLTLANLIFSSAIRASDSGLVDVTEELISKEFETFIAEKETRASAEKFLGQTKTLSVLTPRAKPASNTYAPAISTATTTATSSAAKADPEGQPEEAEPSKKASSNVEALQVKKRPVRDAGVSDEVWDQLQADTREQEKREEEYQAMLQAEKTASGAEREQIVKELLEEEARRKKEEEIRMKLKQRGVCPVGYEWIRQQSGWRCAGGSHFMPDEGAAQM